MGRVSLSTNVDLQNYNWRIQEIARYMGPLGIEIFSLPQNYAPEQQMALPDKAFPYKDKAVISKGLARDIGKHLKANRIKLVQFHYPWQKTLMDMGGHDIALTFNFCDIILQESGAEWLTINHQNVMKYPPPSVTSHLNGEDRAAFMNGLENDAIVAEQIKYAVGSQCILVVENNPAVSIERDRKTGEEIIDNADIVAEDFVNRKGIEGTTLDYSHAWSVVSCFNGDNEYPNIEWCTRHYGGIPKSAKSMEDFVKAVARKTWWIHLSDEPDPYKHSGSHIGDGDIDFKECARLLKEYLWEDAVATIEVNDGHTPDGFKRIIEHDYPVLKGIFGD